MSDHACFSEHQRRKQEKLGYPSVVCICTNISVYKLSCTLGAWNCTWLICRKFAVACWTLSKCHYQQQLLPHKPFRHLRSSGEIVFQALLFSKSKAFWIVVPDFWKSFPTARNVSWPFTPTLGSLTRIFLLG